MKRGAICTLWITVLLTGLPLQAQENVLMKALRDEMGRTMERLQLGDMDRPYYVAYWVQRIRRAGAARPSWAGCSPAAVGVAAVSCRWS